MAQEDEKGGKRHEVPCYHNLVKYLDAWIEPKSCRAWSAGRTDVLPRLTTYLGPRTAPPGFRTSMPPVTM